MPVQMRPIEVEQMVVNLLRNAAESNPSGARVVLRAWVDGGEARVEIADDGVGISEEARTKVFSPFCATRRGDGGTGLGLSIARDVALDHGGRIELDPAYPRGTVARVRLPLAGGEPRAS